MKAPELKSAMLTHMLYRLHYTAAITEYGGKGCIGNADIFGVMKSHLTHEYEVKVDKNDLAGELKSIDVLCNPTWRTGEKNWLDEKGLSKFDKHSRYLNRTPPGEMPQGHRDQDLDVVPNHFSFVVPEELKDFALDTLKDTPYGLVVVAWHENGGHPWNDVMVMRLAKKLHEEKASEEILFNITHKACAEVEVLRRNQADGLRCTSCRGELATRCINCTERMKKDRAYRRASDKCFAKVGMLPYGAERNEAFRKCLADVGF